MTTRALHQLLDLSASRFPDKVAVEESEGGSIRYDELAQSVGSSAGPFAGNGCEGRVIAWACVCENPPMP